MSRRLRNFVFTINNPDEESKTSIEALDSTYVIYQLERGENGTPHYQGYCELRKQTAFATVRDALPRSHLEPRRGSQAQAIEYCRKEDSRVDGPWSTGAPKSQGARVDLEEIRQSIDNGKSLRDIARDDFAKWCQYRRAFAEYRSLIEEKRSWKTKVVWIYGPTGTGKSRQAHEEAPEAYVKPPGKWFDGYNGEDDVIIDDFRAEDIPFSLLLQITDRYPMDVEVKGGFRNWKPKRIFITSNFKPQDLFCMNEDIAPLLRRITEIKELN